MPDSFPVRHESADDQHHFVPQDMRNEVVLGVYGSEEWVMADVVRSRHLANKSTTQIDITWIVPTTFNLATWAADQGYHYTFFSANRVLLQSEEGIIKVTSGRGKIEVEHIGDPKWVGSWMKKFDAEFSRAENLIEWVYNGRGDSVSVPLNFRPAIKAAYPWLKKSIEEYIDDYLNSEASILILLGPPGTGKTSFIKNLIHRSGSDAKVTYDEKVMSDDGLFAGFIDDDTRFMIMEDADVFLQSREEGNTMMHKFLNVSDGLVSAADKKLVFSTNLPNINDIDKALVRPGRCFDVLVFRPLTIDEAHDVVDEIGHGEIPEGKSEITLAELLTKQPSDSFRRKKGIGFTA